MLTVGQLLAIENPGATPPLRASSLQRNFKDRPLSLRTAINQLQGQKAYFFVNIRDITLITGGAVDKNGNTLGPASTVQEVQTRWAATSSTSSTLTTFMKALGNNATVNWLSKDRQTYGMTGTVASFANIPVQILDAAGGLAALGATATTAGGVLMTIASIPEPASPALMLVGASLSGFGAGLLYAAGIWEISPGPPAPAGQGSSGPTSDNNDPGQDTGIDPNNIYGEPPPDDNTTAGVIASIGPSPINPADLPNVPGWGGGEPGDGTGDSTGDGTGDGVGDGGLGFG